MLLLAGGCDLGSAAVVTRSPDLGPPLISASGPDAPGAEASPDAGSDGRRPDSSSPAVDTRDARNAGLDTSIAAEAADVAGSGNETLAVAAEAGTAGEAGSSCLAQGYVLCDDFEDGAAGWMSTGITWEVADDGSDAAPNAVLTPTGPAASSAFFAAGAWQDMTAEVRVRVISFDHASSSDRAELYARYQDASHFYAVSLRGDGKLGLRQNSTSLGPAIAVTVREGDWHTLKIKVSGPQDNVSLEGYLDGVLLVTATDTSGALSSATGTVGVGTYGETRAVFDDVEVSSP